jgi:hypothetical protein
LWEIENVGYLGIIAVRQLATVLIHDAQDASVFAGEIEYRLLGCNDKRMYSRIGLLSMAIHNIAIKVVSRY